MLARGVRTTKREGENEYGFDCCAALLVGTGGVSRTPDRSLQSDDATALKTAAGIPERDAHVSRKTESASRLWLRRRTDRTI